MDTVKWPNSVSEAFQSQFSWLPQAVYGRLVSHVTSAVDRSDKESSFPIIVTIDHDDLNYTASLQIDYCREKNDRVITRFEGTVYTVPLP